jgi:hypothetical protein
MPLWGSNDAASNSTIFAAAQVKVAPNTANRDALFGNTTANAYFDGVTVGQYGVSADEVTAGGGAVAHSGWVLRTVGQGGRAGRVMTEVLVAGGITGDASDDDVFPDYVIVINTQPSDTSANTFAGDDAMFEVVATSIPDGATLDYQWTYANGDAIQAGSNVGLTTTDTLVINSAFETVTTSYKVEISTAGAANVVSANATMTIEPPVYVLSIDQQPQNASANSSDDEQAVFVVVANSTPAGATFAYQWTYANGDALGVTGYSGDTTDTLTVNSNTAVNGESYIVEISAPDAYPIVSDSATITITT